MQFEIKELMKVREQYLEKRRNVEMLFHKLTGAIDLISKQIQNLEERKHGETDSEEKAKLAQE